MATSKKLVDFAYRVTADDNSALKEAWYAAGAAFFGDNNWLDAFVEKGFDNEGEFEGNDDARAQIVKKGTQYMIQVAKMVHELEEAPELIQPGNATDALHVIDEGFALFASNGCDNGNIFINSEKRRKAFDTTTVLSDGTCMSSINVGIIDAFNAMQKAAQDGDKAAAEAQLQAIEGLLFASFAQSALYYADVIEKSLAAGNVTDLPVEAAEGLSFFATILPLVPIETAQNLASQFEKPAAGIYDSVKSEIEAVYSSVGINAATVGELQSTPVDPCATTSPSGPSSPSTPSSPGSPAPPSAAGNVLPATLLAMLSAAVLF